LPGVTLCAESDAWRRKVAASSSGSTAWRARKDSEVRDLLALAQLAPGRLGIVALDTADDLRAVFRLRAAVPCRPDPGGEVVIRQQALLGLRYPEDAVRRSLPGVAFIQLIAPPHCWHPNVAYDAVQPICLAPSVPAGIPAVELVLSAYAALTLQAITLDERDVGGVLNGEATRYWQAEKHRIPLSREPFLGGEAT
jgi:hypothetical protein